jgi:hypothetical protein
MSTMLQCKKSLSCSSSRFTQLRIRSLHCAVPASSAGLREWRGPFSRRTRVLFTPPSTSTRASTTNFKSHNLTLEPQKKSFSSTSAAMTATKIDGTATAKEIRESIRADIENTQKANPRYKPSLKIIQVGERSDSSELFFLQTSLTQYYDVPHFLYYQGIFLLSLRIFIERQCLVPVTQADIL